MINGFGISVLCDIYDRIAERRGHVFLRHDVDYDLDAAGEMALWEVERGIKSAYYLRAYRGEYTKGFNSFENVASLISELGHNVGTHVDLFVGRKVSVTDLYIKGMCEAQRLKLRRETNLPIGLSVSFHAPPSDVYWRNVPHFSHAMGPAWEGRYVADSRGIFPMDLWDMLSDDRPMQINLHPEWWFLPEHEASEMRAREAVKP